MASNSGQDNATKPPYSDYSSHSTVVLSGHSGGVGCVTFSPSDEFIASGSSDRTVKLWDANLGAPIASLPSHPRWISSVAFSPDSNTLASASYDSTLKLWDVRSQAKVATINNSKRPLNCVVFSPNGLLLACGSDDATLRIWDVESKTSTSVLEDRSGQVKSAVFSPDGKRIFSGSSDKTVRIWDVASGNCIARLNGHSGTVYSVAYSPNGDLVASGSLDGTIRLWDPATGGYIATLQGHTNDVNSVVFSPDGKYIASGSDDRTIRLWDLASRTPISTLLGHTARIWSIAFSNDGSRLASASNDSTVRLWRFPQGIGSSVDELPAREFQHALDGRSASAPKPVSLRNEAPSHTPRAGSVEAPSEQRGDSLQHPIVPPNTGLMENWTGEGSSLTSAPVTLTNDITGQVTLENHEEIGLGGFGIVFLGNHRAHGKVALKKPHKLFDDAAARRFLREVDLWCTVTSRYVLPCLGMCKIGPHVYVVSPFIENGDLVSCMARGMDLNRNKLLYQIADALTHLHFKGIVHGDVKAQNVLISNDGTPLLCDFGLAKAFDTMVTSTETKGTGSIRWMAPELFENASRSMATDVYSYGITIAEVLSGQTPFPEMIDNVAVLCHVMFKNGRPAKTPSHSPEGKSYSQLWEVAEKCWAKDATSRPSMAQVLGMIFPLTRYKKN